jgi:hypothetical protein
MNKNLGKVLPYDKFINPDKSTSFQDLFMSACTYIDIKKIELYISKKIIITTEHFYVLMTSFIWKIAKIDRYTKGRRWGRYYGIVTGAEKVMFSGAEPLEWNYDVCNNQIQELLIIFVKHGLNPTKEIYKLLVSLGCYGRDINHLFTFDKEEMREIAENFFDVFFKFSEIMNNVKDRTREKKLGTFTLKNLEILCRSNQLTDILKCKENSKRVINFTKECFVNSLFNYNGEVLEYFIQHGFVPQLYDINMILRPDQRFILLLRFYPHALNMNDLIDIEKINNSIDGKKIVEVAEDSDSESETDIKPEKVIKNQQNTKKIVKAEDSDSESETDIKPEKVIKNRQSTKKIVHIEFDSDSDIGHKKIKSKKK